MKNVKFTFSQNRLNVSAINALSRGCSNRTPETGWFRNNGHYFPPAPEAESQDEGLENSLSGEDLPGSQMASSHLLTVSSCGGRVGGSVGLVVRTLIPSWGPHPCDFHLPKAPSPS